MAKKKKQTESTALVLPIKSEAIIQRAREIGTLTKPENLKELMRHQWVSAQAVKFFKGAKDSRAKLLDAAAFNLRAELQIGSVLQEISRGNDITDTTYEDFLNANMITASQSIRWRDMGYSMAKKLKVKSLIDETLKFTPTFFEAFETYIKFCAADPTGEEVPSFNGFQIHLHSSAVIKAKKERERVLVVFCENLPFLTAEKLYQEMRVSEHLTLTQERFDTLVWAAILDKRNLFFGQALEMNRRDKAKQNAV